MKTIAQLRAENKAIAERLAAGAEARLRAIPGVTHVSVGLKQKAGRATDQLCIRVYVREKRDPRDIPAAELIPAEIDGIATDVNTIGTFEFQIDNTRYRPIHGGAQITNRIIDINPAGTGTQQSLGTLGCIALDNTDNAEVMLSNWHVFTANSGRAGDNVFQPAPTSLPPLELGHLPLRPTDDTDKIGVIRRTRVNNRVDAGIATIDVSSCCHCCGIHYSNEISGLSVAGRPPGNTILGDEPAVAGMTVFKVGQATLRTEGVVIEANYPSFSIERDGTSYSFTGQIAIQNVDPAVAFSDHGDSGSVIVNLNNKIVGLLFASGTNVPPPSGAGAPLPFVSLANHIADVLSELNIRIPYSSEVTVTAGVRLADVPPAVHEAAIAAPYRALRERMQAREGSALLFALGRQHSDEVLHLVNRCRPVTVAWHRAQGPAWLATLMSAVRDGRSLLPARVKGVALHEALARMRAVLSQHGSAALRESLRRREADGLIAAARDGRDLSDMLDRIAAGRSAVLEGAEP
jgi:hypothetical protein